MCEYFSFSSILTMFQLYFSHFNLFEGQTLFESAVKLAEDMSIHQL